MTHHDVEQQPAAQQHFAPQGPVSYQSAAAAPGGPAAPDPTPPPEQKRKSWFARHKLLTALLAIVLLVVLINLVSGGDEESAPRSGAAEVADAVDDTAVDGAAVDEAAEDAPADQESAPGIGDAVLDGKFEFTVTEVEAGVPTVGDEWLSEEAQGQFVLVHLTVHNIGDKAQMLSGSNQTLIDSAGREHSANSSAAIYLEDSETFLTDINPGNSVNGVVVFDIPADGEPAAIELHDSMFSGGVTVTLSE